MSNKIIHSIDSRIIKEYVNYVNNSQSLNRNSGMKRGSLSFNSVNNREFYTKIDYYRKNNKGKLNEVYLDIIKQIAENNNGYITGEFLKDLGISRQYLTNMLKNGDLEKIKRGVYILSNYVYDEYYMLQKKYKKIVYSHMTALYLYNFTEEIPHKKTITVPTFYHSEYLNSNFKIYYSNSSQYKLGLTTIKTNIGSEVFVYDLERCICDIIIHQNSQDFEQVKKTVKNYVKCKQKDYLKLSRYARQLNAEDKIMKFVGMYEE